MQNLAAKLTSSLTSYPPEVLRYSLLNNNLPPPLPATDQRSRGQSQTEAHGYDYEGQRRNDGGSGQAVHPQEPEMAAIPAGSVKEIRLWRLRLISFTPFQKEGSVYLYCTNQKKEMQLVAQLSFATVGLFGIYSS